MNNRIPIAILVVLILVAIIWRVANPPVPPLPGPLGVPPTWDSRTTVGDMFASAVNPAGTMWAGAWNHKTSEGKLNSALVVVDLAKSTAYRQNLGEGMFVGGLGWADDNTVRVLLVDSGDPARITVSKIAYLRGLGGKSPKFEAGNALPKAVARILSWPPGSKFSLAQIASSLPGVEVAVLDEAGATAGRSFSVVEPNGAGIYQAAALAPDGGSFVFSTSDGLGGHVVYHYMDARGVSAPKFFTSKDMPGRVEGMWISPAGVLAVVSQRDKFETRRYDPATGKIGPASGMDIAKSWPTAPKSMMFVTYNGGYDLDLATGKTKQLFDLTRQGRLSDSWRRHVQDGRLYPRKDGNYTAISVIAREADIRVIEKDGNKGADILPRG